jgi:hypothetical protein
MLRVIVQMVPFGNESEARELGRLEIANISGLGVEHARYRVQVNSQGHEKPLAGLIRHRRSAGFWPLVAKAARTIARAKGKP